MNKMNNNDKPQELNGILTSLQAANHLGISRRWFYTLVENGKIPPHVSVIGRSLLWNSADIYNYKK